MRIIWPVGSTSGPNSCSLTVLPSTATFDALLTSCGLKNMPYFTGHCLMSGKSTSVPSRRVDQFWLPAMTCARRFTPGAMYCTSGTSFLIASTSSIFRLDAAPTPPRTPPIVKLPAMIVTMLVPPALICSSIWTCAPLPSATSVITADTPMIMPSMVSAVRILLRASAFRAIRVVITGDMGDPRI